MLTEYRGQCFVAIGANSWITYNGFITSIESYNLTQRQDIYHHNRKVGCIGELIITPQHNGISGFIEVSTKDMTIFNQFISIVGRNKLTLQFLLGIGRHRKTVFKKMVYVYGSFCVQLVL